MGQRKNRDEDKKKGVASVGKSSRESTIVLSKLGLKKGAWQTKKKRVLFLGRGKGKGWGGDKERFVRGGQSKRFCQHAEGETRGSGEQRSLTACWERKETGGKKGEKRGCKTRRK